MLARYQSIGTQAALICGFSISSLTGLAASSDIVSPTVSHLFYITTFVLHPLAAPSHPHHPLCVQLGSGACPPRANRKCVPGV